MRYHFRKIVTLIKNKLHAELLHMKCSAYYFAIYSFIQPRIVFPLRPNNEIKAMFMITLPDRVSVHTYKYGDFCAIPVT